MQVKHTSESVERIGGVRQAFLTPNSQTMLYILPGIFHARVCVYL